MVEPSFNKWTFFQHYLKWSLAVVFFVYFPHLSLFFVCNDKHVYLSLTYDVRGVVRTKGLHGWGLDLGG